MMSNEKVLLSLIASRMWKEDYLEQKYNKYGYAEKIKNFTETTNNKYLIFFLK